LDNVCDFSNGAKHDFISSTLTCGSWTMTRRSKRRIDLASGKRIFCHLVGQQLQQQLVPEWIVHDVSFGKQPPIMRHVLFVNEFVHGDLQISRG
jgi:hypothetical protein